MPLRPSARKSVCARARLESGQSVIGTTRTLRDVRAMSVTEGTSEVKCSLRVFRMMTRSRRRD
jgi:hypothetical protein